MKYTLIQYRYFTTYKVYFVEIMMKSAKSVLMGGLHQIEGEQIPHTLTFSKSKQKKDKLFP